MTGGLQRCANTLVGTEADADLLGMTPEPEARPAPASAQHAETIADLRIVSAKDSTEQFSSMSSLSVKCPAGQNEVLVSVGAAVQVLEQPCCSSRCGSMVAEEAERCDGIPAPWGVLAERSNL